MDHEAQAHADIPRWASGVTAIYGLSGAGKSSLADTGCEFVAERFGLQTFCVANDPGGWGNRRLSLIRQGVMIVYDPTNHVNYFETMEALSKGAMPEKILDADRGYAAPDVRLIHPRADVWIRKCPQNHQVKVYYDQAIMLGSIDQCPTCQIMVNVTNQITESAKIKPAMFKRVGLRIFDSVTAMSDQGLMDLARMSAAGELPVSTTGGSALGSADAIRQGTFVAGTGSKAQVGFMQNRAYGWLVNIRAIPDQVMGAICTFGVEQSGGDDTRGGGEICYGLALAGNARTARAGGWVGNLLHATKEPDDAGHTRFKLWLTNHIDPRDTYKRPYLAKHRGTPLGMPDFLEDPWSDDPREREKLAWSVCSLSHFYKLLELQFVEIAKADQVRFAGFASVPDGQDEVVSAAQAIQLPTQPAAGVAISGGRGLRRPGMAVAVPAQPSIIHQQLEASLVARQAEQIQPPVPAPPPNGNAAGQTSAAAGDAAGTVPVASAMAPAVALTPPVTNAASPVPVATSPAPAPVAPGRLRRVARPPV